MTTEQELKAAIRQRDGMKCTKCGITNEQHLQNHGKSLHVHRVKPGSLYSIEDGVCVTLCFACHGPEPRRGKNEPDLVRTTRQVAVPADWYAVMCKLAARHRQPVLWWLIDQAEQTATKLGLNDLPRPPWTEEQN